MPVSANGRLFRIRRAALALKAALQRDPTDAEMASEIGSSPREVRRLWTVSLQPASLDQPLEGGKIFRSWNLFRTNLRLHLPKSWPARLSGTFCMKCKRNDMDRAVLSHRFGMDGDGERTLAEVGRCLGITREWTRLIQNRALQKLRGMLAARSMQTMAA
jgi:RNA polymerase primary sigma factor